MAEREAERKVLRRKIAAKYGDIGAIIAREGHFILGSKQIVLDTNTGLAWIAGVDSDITWNAATYRVERLTVAGGGWRMPTIKELKTLYQKGAGTRNMTPLLKTTGWFVWSGETKGPCSAWDFKFPHVGEDFGWVYHSDSVGGRGFAVRSRRK